MAWTNIDNALVSVGALPFATTIQALRDNPIAIANGDAGAPPIQPAALPVSTVADRIANQSAGGIGTYVFARSTTASNVVFGSTRAGSQLVPTSAVFSVSASQSTAQFSVGSALSGTWRCMGFYDHTETGGGGELPLTTIFGATLWLRIS